MTSGTNHRDETQRRAEERFRLVVESSPAAMVIVNQQGRIELVNRQTENWFGYRREELIGEPVELLVPPRYHRQHVIDRDRFLGAPIQRPMGAERDLYGLRKDGSEFPVDISLHPMETEGGRLVMAHIIDLTDRKRAAEESRLRHSMERLALLGQLAGGVAHEIRNPLAVIRNAAYYLQMIQDTLDEDARDSVAEIQREVDTANEIVGDLLDYARDKPQQKSSFDLVDRVGKLVADQQKRLAATIELETCGTPLPVQADSGQVDRILMNLIRNGVQASGEAGRISITLRSESGAAVLDVCDQGTGIAEENRPRVFEPLFTTKAKGIGLGLAVSRRYAERNGGTLELVDRPGPGTTFRLTLPLAESH
jgi:PAS domain S-box-containing protein